MENPNHIWSDKDTLANIVIHSDKNDERIQMESLSSRRAVENVEERNNPIYGIVKTNKITMDEKIEKMNIHKYEIFDSDENAGESVVNEESKMLTEKKKKREINGCDLLNAVNNPSEIPEYIILRHARKGVFKTFEDIHCENKKTFPIQFPTCVKNVCSRDNAKLRSLWFWRILSLFLSIIIAVVYMNTSPPVHHVYHRYHKKKFYDYILFFYCDHLPNLLNAVNAAS
ncbi:GfV-B45-ORF1 [Ichnoviriform fumiferanae]|uniref:GfV-B45-ORF1 n=1 Tax=Ichnoviriform fumiferanae TaxID=419435 RepID=A2PZU1_9VIRU|nr:GfV-B45-ORF1 [Ichnoviriform fumiferanae]BAF45513.1 GfV-B45-ORF1 [Ichnoviriform fumiferanae]